MGVPRRAVRQILLGFLPLLVICVGCLILLSLRLDEANDPLRSATERAEAEVTGTGLGADARQISVQYTDLEGRQQNARLTLDEVVDIPLGETFDVFYDPDRPGAVYANGDAVTGSVSDIVNGLLFVGLLLVVAISVTVVRLVNRRRLARREPQPVTVHREKYRRGLADRSWLVVHGADGETWVPVYWDEAVEQVPETPVAATAYGDPDRDSLIGFELYGEPVWPSGRRRRQAPKGRLRDLPDHTGGVSLARQSRTDVIGVFAAPLIGILWSYSDGSGPAGFVFATVAAIGLLFWLPSVYGSDPT